MADFNEETTKIIFDNRERIVRVEHQSQTMNRRMEKMEVKVNEMHDILLKAKGAKWLGLILLTIGVWVVTNLETVWGLIKLTIGIK